MGLFLISKVPSAIHNSMLSKTYMKNAWLVLIQILLFTASSQGRPTFAKKALVVSASNEASQAGISIIKRGGNVVDGAVATAFALAVTRPYYASLGGGGFLLLRLNGKIQALDYRERAPLAATRDMFLNQKKEASTVGGLAVATPGNVGGLYELHKKYGKLKWSQLLKPAFELAQNGFPVTEEFHRMISENSSNFSPAGLKYFAPNGKTPEIGSLFKQPSLARALKIIMAQGADGFYSGEVAKDIVSSAQASGGILTLEDLKKYRSRWLEPLKTKVFDVDVYSMPPPSSGGAILLTELKMAEKINLAAQKTFSSTEYHLLSEIMSRAFFGRKYISDIGFSKFDPKDLYSDLRIKRLSADISPNKKIKFENANFEFQEGINTTHYIVSDSLGNVVTATTTVNTEYGSGVFTNKFGINLNNEMDDFTTRPGEANVFGLTQSEINTVAPLKTPLSSMTPTLIEKNGHFFMALGAPGGPRIINAVFQIAFHALTTKFNLDEIIQMPRVHHQFSPDRIMHDRTLSPDIVAVLEKLGHTTIEGGVARVYGVRQENEKAPLEGAFDNRGEGGIASY